MPRPKRWTVSEVQHGCVTVNLHSWRYFLDYVYQQMLDYETYIWRGQRCDNWLLKSTFDRLIKGARVRPGARRLFRQAHLDRFTYAARGRRGSNPTPINNENDWWALGQHHGLSTPLLDWTNSPFVAAYFAFVGLGVEQTSRRAVFALHQPTVETKALELQIAAEKTGSSRFSVMAETSAGSFRVGNVRNCKNQRGLKAACSNHPVSIEFPEGMLQIPQGFRSSLDRFCIAERDPTAGFWPKLICTFAETPAITEFREEPENSG